MASADYAVVIGDGADVAAANAIGIGARSIVTSQGTNSVALGADSLANEPNTVSIGSPSQLRRLTYMGMGVSAWDATTVAQLDQVAAGQSAWLGGGANVTKTAAGAYLFNAPSYALSSPGALGVYNNVGGALSALDRGLSSLYNTVSNLPPPGTGPAGPTGPAGQPGSAAGGDGTDAMAVHYDDSLRSSVTLQGLGGTQIHNLAAGAASTDAANVAQLDAATANAIATAKTYTDVSATRTLQSANDYTDWRVSQLDDRFRKQEASINRAGAAASAMGLMAGSAASIQNADVLSMAVAGYRGEGAVSVGLNHHFSERVALTVGAAFGASNAGSVGAGLAIGLH
ncbi:YadA-like family protein [Xanthomonas sp. NCPPB 2632]|uniref:YadA-like family protein n=1 Tax=Xanthomonas sp. NCPPB 2632 TaxID=3240912 RepID=UPI0035170DA8